MSIRACRWSLWLTFLFTVPVPFFLVERGRVPVARLLQLAGAALALVASEGTQGKILTLVALLLGQAILFAVVLWAAAYVVARLAARLSSRRRLYATALIVVTIALVTALANVYRTPFSKRTLNTTLLRVYE